MSPYPTVRLKFKSNDSCDDRGSSPGLIRAYTGATPDIRPQAHKTHDRERPPLLYALALLLMLNCTALLTRGTPPEGMFKLKDRFTSVLPRPQSPTPASVITALQLATANEARLLIDNTNDPLPQELLRSSLATWRCSQEAEQWSKRVRASHSATSGMVKKLLAGEAAARGCTADRSASLPELRSVLTIGAGALSSSRKGKVTFATQVPLARLHVLEDQCKLWSGLPMVAVVYIQLLNGRPEGYPGLDAALAAVLKLSTAAACKLAVEAVVEDVCSDSSGGVAEPTNALRNRALQLVATEAVFLGDSQHLVSVELAKSMTIASRRTPILEAARTHAGVLVPAFAPTNPWYGRVARQLSIEWAKSRHLQGVMRQVQENQLEGPAGWGLANEGAVKASFERWASTEKGELNTTKLGDGAAPLALMLTVRVPWFDERLRGEEWATALHVRHVEAVAETSQWAVMGGAWAIRVAPKGQVVGKKPEAAHGRANKVMFGRHRAAVAERLYLPVVAQQELCSASSSL